MGSGASRDTHVKQKVSVIRTEDGDQYVQNGVIITVGRKGRRHCKVHADVYKEDTSTAVKDSNFQGRNVL